MSTTTEQARPAGAGPEPSGPPPLSRGRTLRACLLVALAFGAGATDIVGFLGMHQVFTANMTGNIVLFGLAAGEGSGADLARCGVATLAFALGALGGFLLAGTADGRLWPVGVTRTLAAGLVVQAAFLAGWIAADARPGGGALLALIALSAAAMGVQSAAARGLTSDAVSTTFVTGTLTSMMGALATGSAQGAGLRTATIAALAAGAAAGGALMGPAPEAAAAIGPAITVAVIALAFRLHRHPG
ncbi:YoaK family protein [Actinomadura viridis]|uniref:YoaK family protein n=1 Tax=Actinomadura viridis TaxID=58110 RepID=UPI003677FF2E